MNEDLNIFEVIDTRVESPVYLTYSKRVSPVLYVKYQREETKNE